MKALTIQQPWATLIALGEKRFETRSRRTNIRGRIAIHAGKTIDKEACDREPIKSTLAKHGYTIDNLPTGAVIATAELTESYPINLSSYSFAAYVDHKATIVEVFEDEEFQFGWYEEGRHAWELANVKQIEPEPAKGQQGWWNWEGVL